MLFTFVPILYVASLDQDLSATVAMENPSIYKDGIQRVFITVKIFWLWMIEGIMCGAVMFFIPIFCLGTFAFNHKGYMMGLYELGAIVFVIDILVVSIRLAMEICYWTGIEVACFLFSLVFPGIWSWWYVFSTFNIAPPGVQPPYRIAGTHENLFGQGIFWCITVLCCVMSGAPALAALTVKRSSFPSRSDIGGEMTVGWRNGVKDSLSRGEAGRPLN